MSAAVQMPGEDAEAVDPVQSVRNAMAAFAAGLEAGTGTNAQLDAIQTAGHAALATQSRQSFVAMRAQRAGRGPQPERRVRTTRPEASIRLTDDTAAAILAFLGIDKRWRRQDVVNVPPVLRAALEIGEAETQDDADRLAFERLAYLFQHRPAFVRGCSGLRLPEGGMPAETIGIEPPRHDPIPEPNTDQGWALQSIGEGRRVQHLGELGNPTFPTREEETSARHHGWRAMLDAHRAARRSAGASIGEAQAEREVIALVPGWARAVGFKGTRA